MRIDVHDQDRLPVARIEVNPSEYPASVEDKVTKRRVDLQWEDAIESGKILRRCVVCGCRDIFVRKDFPQGLGLGLVLVAAIASVILFARNQLVASIVVLALAVVIDALLYRFIGKCLVCYRCRSEFRATPIDESHEPWDLAIGEKYRPIHAFAAEAGSDEEQPT